MGRAGTSQVNSSQAVLRCEFPGTVVQRPRSVRDDTGEGVREVNTLARNSLSSEELASASDEGVEETQLSDGEVGARVSGEPEVKEDESSPEREMESDWSGGQASAQVPVPAPPPADPQDYRVYFYDPKVPLASLVSDNSNALLVAQ